MSDIEILNLALLWGIRLDVVASFVDARNALTADVDVYSEASAEHPTVRPGEHTHPTRRVLELVLDDAA